MIINNETWHWDIKGQYDRDMPRLLSSTGEEICNFGNCTTYYPTEGSPPMPHHMALIAAAPDNYACNIELAKIVRELCNIYGHPLPEASLERSDAAIKKTTRADNGN